MILEAFSDSKGIEITDPVEKTRFPIRTPTRVSPADVAVDDLDFPVETAVEIRTSAIEIPLSRGIFVRDFDGRLRFESGENSDGARLPSDDYVVEISNAPMKVYFSVSGSVSFERNHSESTFSFERERRIVIGARSQFQKPPGTITVTDDADDIMRAMSVFGSALKTTSPERSYPTLRGHPPLIERGEEFHVSSSIPSSATETTLVLPPEREYLYPATSLAYYLNSSVVPGKQPRLVADSFEYELDGDDGYEATVERVLRQVFFLDCLTRTNGFYSVQLHEREVVEPRLDIDLDALFDAPVAERLPAYLGVPFETLEPAISPWHLAVDMVPSEHNVEYLPFLANKLAFVRTARLPSEATEKSPELMHEFYRAGVTDSPISTDIESKTRPEIFELKGEPDTIERAWVGPGYPLRWSKLTYDGLHAEATRNKTTENASTPTIDVTIVCNDTAMQDESDVVRYYDLRELPRFDISVHHRTTKAELEKHLTEQSDFFHYIGHISDDGIQCEDGYLDARGFSEVNATTFLLNACNSYRQGTALIERGSTAGIATLSKVSNTTATDIGRSLVQLLSIGFQLQTALTVLNRVKLTGYRYIALGDSSKTLCQSESIVTPVIRVKDVDSGIFKIEVDIHPTRNTHRGTILETAAENASRYHLLAGKVGTFEFTPDRLEEYFAMERSPVEIDGELYWSDELSAEEVTELL
ncbi:hypothetical protein ZOD2009_00685 [Haladaptatus paucihalophilus DX253]|uniref:CHAT domain-containing protein n=1 Tax=Haladaptatus paucihalophilus DX253 TaxID=797209 RepID=E7QNW1_HALPU|nr:hypothetical protein [Haladaptatus paucihalophilus]EFW93614.1 hypothetical protein ZOD2009_00685 [Haladaptatus paucihalophilus DX253]SHL45560.1 hypothetical protein SAMN05444342_3841 [Haladaptatus paucihalophilus DX253]